MFLAEVGSRHENFTSYDVLCRFYEAEYKAKTYLTKSELLVSSITSELSELR